MKRNLAILLSIAMIFLAPCGRVVVLASWENDGAVSAAGAFSGGEEDDIDVLTGFDGGGNASEGDTTTETASEDDTSTETTPESDAPQSEDMPSENATSEAPADADGIGADKGDTGADEDDRGKNDDDSDDATADEEADGADESLITVDLAPETLFVGGDIDDNDALFAAYAKRVLYEGIDDTSAAGSGAWMSLPAYNSRVPRRAILSAPEKKLYDLLSEQIALVANGERESTEFKFAPEEIIGKTSYTAAELGLSDLSDQSAISDALHNLYGDPFATLTALRYDFPYEFYWVDKTVSQSVQKFDSYSYNSKTVTIKGNMTIKLRVAAAYSKAGEQGTTQADTSKTGAAVAARANAEAIVTSNEDETDYNKLLAYRDAICGAVSYNYDAVNDKTTLYGDPWQLIYVFDNNPATNVVCEGYSKAFQLLCDLSSFDNEWIDCITVAGTMQGGTGAGGHMWNVLTMDDGENYLADLTNSDAGATGNFRLFMRGAPDGDAGGYTIGGVSYKYFDQSAEGHDNMLALYTDAQRELSKNDEYVFRFSASPVATVRYHGETLDASEPVPSGAYLSLATPTAGAQIYYKEYATEVEALSDRNPFADLETQLRDETVYQYKEPLRVEKDITVRAIARMTGMQDSEITTISLRVRDASDEWGDLKDDDRDAIKDRDNNGKIDAADVPTGIWTSGIEDFVYDGVAKTQDKMRVYYHTKPLTRNLDYTVKYKNNKSAGTATVTITGKGNYTGVVTQTFEIKKVNLEEAFLEGSLSAPDILRAYNKKLQKGTTTVKMSFGDRQVALKAGTDFTYFYPHTNSKSVDPDDLYDGAAFKEAGTYEIRLTGKGNYGGAITIKETITHAKLISKMSLQKIANQTYTGEQVEPKIVLKDGKRQLEEGADYEVIYENNVGIGTATVTITGKGDPATGEGYVGSRTTTFKITGTSLSKAKIAFDVKKLSGYDASVKGWIYTGLTIEPAEGAGGGGISITYKGNELKRGVDYAVTYQKNSGVGTASVIFTGTGAYTGTVKKTFKIAPYDIAADDAYAETSEDRRLRVSWESDPTKAWDKDGDNDPSYAYLKGGVKPEPVVTYTYRDGENTISYVLQKGREYTLSYANYNKVGDKDTKNGKKSAAPTVTITGKGNFKGKIARTYTIVEQDLRATTLTAGDVVYRNKPNICNPAVTLTDANGAKLKAGIDYEKTFSYTYVHKTNVEVKSGKTVSQAIRKGEISEEKLGAKVNATDVIPAGTYIRVTVTGKGNYAGSKASAVFRYVAADVSKASVSVKAQTYDGHAVEPSKDDITIKIGKTVLDKTDYEIVSYANNTGKGTGKITLRGVGNYGGTKTVTFRITAKTFVWYGQ